MKRERGKTTSGNYGIHSSPFSPLFLRPLPLPRHSFPIFSILNLFSGKIVFSLGGSFGAEKNRFLFVHSTLHSTTCSELIKCILNDLLEHQEEKVLDRFCSSISGISSRDS